MKRGSINHEPQLNFTGADQGIGKAEERTGSVAEE